MIVCAARWNWPPSETRKQTMRDLRLLMMHLEYAAEED